MVLRRVGYELARRVHAGAQCQRVVSCQTEQVTRQGRLPQAGVAKDLLRVQNLEHGVFVTLSTI